MSQMLPVCVACCLHWLILTPVLPGRTCASCLVAMVTVLLLFTNHCGPVSHERWWHMKSFISPDRGKCWVTAQRGMVVKLRWKGSVGYIKILEEQIRSLFILLYPWWNISCHPIMWYYPWSRDIKIFFPFFVYIYCCFHAALRVWMCV